jgi:hypothetical protein
MPRLVNPLNAEYFYHAGDESSSPYVATLNLSEHAALVKTKGLYLLPKKGVIQIIVANQEKTGLKVFIVPYDVTDMPPRTNTVVRQTTHVASRSGSSTMRLCYAVQIPFMASKHGRVYIHRKIKVFISLHLFFCSFLHLSFMWRVQCPSSRFT